jgi:hypothetical protein
MTINLFQTQEYKALIQEHIANTIAYLFSRDQEFAIACETKYIDFDPPLPEDILESFKDTVLFVLSGYTYESAKLEREHFSFEAGFGEANFGSMVTMPLLAIKQVIVGEHPIVLNLAQPAPKQELSKKSSMEALLNNPENKKLLKKKKR